MVLNTGNTAYKKFYRCIFVLVTLVSLMFLIGICIRIGSKFSSLAGYGSVPVPVFGVPVRTADQVSVIQNQITAYRYCCFMHVSCLSIPVSIKLPSPSSIFLHQFQTLYLANHAFQPASGSSCWFHVPNSGTPVSELNNFMCG